MSITDSTERVQPVDFADAIELIAEYGRWTECAAFRFVRNADTVSLQISHRPACTNCRGTGRLTAVGYGHKTETYDCMVCGGLGRQPVEGGPDAS